MKRSTIKRAMENLRAARMQVESLERSIRNIRSGYARDSVKASSPNFPYTEYTAVVEGYTEGERQKALADLETKKDRWIHQVRVAERVLNGVEPEMQDILRRYYENGQTMEEIGEELGYSKSSISTKIKKFFEESKD